MTTCNFNTWNAPRVLIIVIFALFSDVATAAGRVFDVTGDLIGELALTTTVDADTLLDVAKAYDQGFEEMRLANPTVDTWLPGEDTELLVPSHYILPNTKRRGIVINVPEMRMYVYPKSAAGARVYTYPISIGRQDWVTPHGDTRITQKVKDPNWYPPESIRLEHAERGDPLPKVVPAGPDNPLGQHALRLSLPGYLIHGTNKPSGIGMRVTHGCIRMYPENIESVFSMVKVGTPVSIVNQPYKVGFANGTVYLEVHPPLEEDTERFKDEFTHVVELIIQQAGDAKLSLNWADLQQTLKRRSGMPEAVATFSPAAPATVSNLTTRSDRSS